MPLWQATLRPFGSEAIPFASYYIPVTPAISCNYALFCATARLHPLYFQWVPHSFRCHGGGYPPLVAPALFPKRQVVCVAQPPKHSKALLEQLVQPVHPPPQRVWSPPIPRNIRFYLGPLQAEAHLR